MVGQLAVHAHEGDLSGGHTQYTHIRSATSAPEGTARLRRAEKLVLTGHGVMEWAYWGPPAHPSSDTGVRKSCL